jgi:NAD(P)-dependent dehydrogenase (short-subunit alcohol dehydrogenase family)
MAVIIITGSSTGIGFSTAQILAQGEHKVYATMRNPDQSPQLQALASRENLPITVLPLDVDSDASVKAGIEYVLSQEGRIDVLINNAGINAFTPVEESPMEVFRKVMETNYFGTVRCIQAVLPTMRAQKSGCIINVSSVAAKVYSNFHAAYCASKAAVEALSESLAQEVQPFSIRIALVEPGVIETPIFQKGPDLNPDTHYPRINRFLAFFAASLENHVQPTVVGEAIQEIVAGTYTQFRYPVGPDAIPLISWRASMSAEDWIASVNIDEETWATAMEQGLQLNVRSHIKNEVLLHSPIFAS